jgi:hypothetical protein
MMFWTSQSGLDLADSIPQPRASMPHPTLEENTMTKHNQRDRNELESDSAGQSGDNQQISDVAGADSESVAELLDEGNAFEAGIVSGVENAKDADVSEVTTREVPEGDVPEEYLNDDVA